MGPYQFLNRVLTVYKKAKKKGGGEYSFITRPIRDENT